MTRMRRLPLPQDWPRLALMAGVKLYRLTLSPWIGNACRFTPSCSLYSLQALALHGAAKGSYLTLRRIGRCNPWCQGGHDPVPAPCFPFPSSNF